MVLRTRCHITKINGTVRQQTKLQAPLFARRAELISRIPHFWALVLEQAPPEIDQFIQPSDSQVLASHLVSIDVQRFEIAPAAAPGADEGNPRSVLIRFQFSPNDWFEDEVLEKQFWFRHSLTGWSGLVSEPVRIRWKGGKDLTEGLTEAAFVAWEAEQRASNGSSSLSVGQKSSSKRLPEQEALCKMMETSTEGSLSFFTWFGYRGRHVTAEESAQAVAAEKKKRETYKAGDANDGQEEKATREEKPDGDEDNDDDDDDAQMAMEVFPAGEDLAIAVSEDLFPAAVKYFSELISLLFPEQAASQTTSPDSGGKGERWLTCCDS